MDGHQLGRVSETQEGYFRVEGTEGQRYWLNNSVISAVGPERVDLLFEADQLSTYHMDRAGADNELAPVLDEQGQVFAPADES